MADPWRYMAVKTHQATQAALLKVEFGSERLYLSAVHTNTETELLGRRCLADLHAELFESGVPHNLGIGRDAQRFRVIDMLSISREIDEECVLRYATDLMDDQAVGVH